MNLLDRFGAFLILPFLIQSLTKAEYSVWSQFIILPPIIATILSFGLERGILNFFANDEKKNVEQSSLALIMLTAFLLIFIFYFISVVNSELVINFIFGLNLSINFLNLIFLMILSETLFLLASSYQRAKLFFNYLSTYLFIRFVLKILTVIWLIYFAKMNLEDALGFYIFLLLFTSCLFIFFIFYRSDISFLGCKDFILSLIKYSFPLLLAGLIFPSLLIGGRQTLLLNGGPEILADFSLGFSILGIPSVLFAMLNFIFFTYMANLHNSRKFEKLTKFFKEYFALNLFLFICVISFLMFNLDYIYILLGASEYILKIETIVLFGLMFFAQFMYEAFYRLMILNKDTKQVLICNISALLLSLIYIFIFSILNLENLLVAITIYYSFSFIFLGSLLIMDRRLFIGGSYFYHALLLIGVQLVSSIAILNINLSKYEIFQLSLGIAFIVAFIDFYSKNSIIKLFYNLVSK